MTWPGIEPRSPRPLANTLPTNEPVSINTGYDRYIFHILSCHLCVASEFKQVAMVAPSSWCLTICVLIRWVTIMALTCLVGRGSRIHGLHLCRGVKLNECSGYDIKQSDGEVLVMLQLWGRWITPSLSSLPGPLWLDAVVPNNILFMDQIELFDIKTVKTNELW